MNRSTLFLILLVAIAWAIGQESTFAQTNYLWLPTSPPGNWNDKANWDDAGGDFVPEGSASETATINNGGTAFVVDVIDNTGSTGGGKLGPGRITLLNNSVLEIRSSALMSTDSSGIGVNGEVSTASGASLRFLGNGALSADILTLGTTGIFDYRVTTASSFSSAPASILGAAQLGGVLQVDFGAGTSFSVGDIVQLVDAGTVQGQFSAINLTGNVANPTGIGQRVGVQKVAGGNGTIAQLVFEQLLVLTVNRDTKDMSISNPASMPIEIDGFTISSAVGSLDDASFSGLGAGWFTSPTTPNRVTQLRTAGTTAFANGTPTSVGPIFSPPAPTVFGVESDDLQFSYTLAGNIEVEGYVNYVGDKQYNNLVLTIDEDGMATIQNESPLTVAIEGYTIASTAGLLDSVNWNSLDEQNAEGGRWSASSGSDEFRVTELMTEGTTTFTSLKGFSLGKLYDDTGAGSVEDLTFQFLIAGETNPFTGIVVFGDLPNLPNGLDGDFNGDNVVNAADYVFWRDQLVDSNSYNTWKANFGATAGSGVVTSAAVPEPSTSVLLVMLGVLPATGLRRKFHRG